MTEFLKLHKIGAEVLKVRAAEVDNFKEPELYSLIDDLFSMMRNHNGAGLAAPQIGFSKRVFVYGFKHNPRYPEKKPVLDSVVINPKVIEVSDEVNEDYEGCLSVPGIRGLVSRPSELIYEGVTPEGDTLKKHLTGFEARIFFHELDHLDGVHFLERVVKPESIHCV